MASIRKRGNHWQVQVRVAGKPARSKTFKSKKEARQWSFQTHQKLLELCQNDHINGINFGDILIRYRDNVVSTKLARRVETSIINQVLKSPIAKLSVNEVTYQEVCKYRDDRLKTITPNTMSRELGVIRHAWRIANEEWDLTPKSNPFKSVRLPKGKGPRERRLRYGELEQILKQASQQKNQYPKFVILFALETAMRGQEILNLKWQDIDPERCTVRIRKAKNALERNIPLTPTALKILMYLPSESHEYVFPISMSLMKQAWKRILAKTDIEDLHFHDLRHESISRFIDGGLNVPEVAAISGHRDSRSLLRYAHPSPEKLREKFMNLEGLNSIEKQTLNSDAPNVLKLNIHFRGLQNKPGRNFADDNSIKSSKLCAQNQNSLESKPWKILRELSQPFLNEHEEIENFQANRLQEKNSTD